MESITPLLRLAIKWYTVRANVYRSGVRTVDPDADSAALFRIMGETLAPHHAAVTQTQPARQRDSSAGLW